MRWSEIFLSLLKRNGFTVEIPENWDGLDSSLLIEGRELWDDINNVMADSKHELFKDYTFLISRLFDARVKSFFKNVLLGRGKDKIPISHYSYRVEFQARGLPHIHGVAWIEKDFLLSRGIEGTLMDNEEASLELADELISCRLPDPEEIPLGPIVEEVQKHKHTKSCRKYNGNCRYGFPKLPSPETLIAKPIEFTHPNLTDDEKRLKKERAEDVLRAAKQLLDDPDFKEEMSIEEFCKMIGTDEKEYVELLGISEQGKVLVMKRECNARYINNYNPEMIAAWNANMDIQLVIDPYAVVSYIANYMNKDETQTTPFLREALHASAGKTAKDKLRTLKEAYLTHRQVGASEAAYKILPNLRLKDSNISCVFVTTGFPKNRSKFFTRVHDDDQEDNDDENEVEDIEDQNDEDFQEQKPPSSIKCTIEGREGKYQESINVIDRYTSRPIYLEEMCLAQFAISYVFASKVPKRVIFDENGISNEFSAQTIFHSDKLLPKYVSLESSGLGKLRLRNFPAVMRIHSSKKKDGHEQHYSELLLFTAWDDEKQFHADDADECINMYHEKFEEIKQNKETIYPGEETLLLMENIDLEHNKPEHMFDMLDSQRQQENEEDKKLGTTDDPEYESFAYTGNLCQEKKTDYETSKYRKIAIPEEEERNFLTRRLASEQLDILREVVGYCKDVIRSQKNPSHEVNPLRIIIHGGAGSGKSSIIKVVAMHAERILRKAGDKPNHPRVLLTAHTGKAASIIDGQTISGAFAFRFGDEAQAQYGDKKLAELREHLSELKLIVIDEMSLVSSDMFYKLDMKLREIFKERKKTPFGGIGIILVGDLLQIPPVTGVYIFMEPRNNIYNVSYHLNNLWQFFKPWILTYNHRQGEGCKWANVLNRFREGIITDEDLDLLRSRETEDSHLDFDAMHLCYKNLETQDHNDKMLSKLAMPKMLELEAIKRYPKGRRPYIKPDGRLEDLNILDVLKVKIGARVVMVFNVDTLDDLCNGSTGTIIAFEYNEKKDVECIIVQFDMEKMGRNQRLKYPNLALKYKRHNGTPIFRQEMETMGKSKRGSKLGSGSSAKVYQFPLIVNYASTNHKIQVTIDTIALRNYSWY